MIQTVGKRKKAVARATLRNGSGKVRINGKLLSTMKNKYIRLRIEEPLILSRDVIPVENIDISVNVRGGGIWGQSDATRTAIGKALLEYAFNIKKNLGEKLKNLFLEYDRSLLVSDARRTESHKPSRSSAGPRRKKQQSKR